MNNTIYGGTTATPTPITLVDQTYNPESENAQSGKAVRQAMGFAEEAASLGSLALYEIDNFKLYASENYATKEELGRGNVDQTYDPDSENAQSGKAVRQAVSFAEEAASLGSHALYELGEFKLYASENYATKEELNTALGNIEALIGGI